MNAAALDRNTVKEALEDSTGKALTTRYVTGKNASGETTGLAVSFNISVVKDDTIFVGVSHYKLTNPGAWTNSGVHIVEHADTVDNTLDAAARKAIPWFFAENPQITKQ